MTNVRLAIGLSYYNDRECLKRLLKSIRVPHRYRQDVILIAIDGRYRGYDSEKPDESEYRRSTDGSYELIERNSASIRTVNTVTPITLDEREKRQQYVDLATKLGCDFLLITDADEWFEVLNWQRLFEELSDIRENERGVNNVFTIHCVDVGNDQPQYRKRLWAKPETMRYGDRHWRFSIRGVVRPIPSDLIQIYHDSSSCRTAERLQKQREYEDNLESLESGSGGQI